ncbi:hypothetical protein [Schaalia sp. lx-100]|uniref:hypothetical protein n=1 Tax=Schaalia sp. lx-100 TaxID=2899081 RepID=UPI001E44B156|nr:hypothetical protein [Schaalia sp. lx-100]MCD4558224.1 hypothetical protein [Schaalia sp. lx-100]
MAHRQWSSCAAGVPPALNIKGRHMLDLTAYLPQPFHMKADKWEITSPVPSVETGKLITGFQALQAEQFRRAQAGEEPLVTDTIPGWPTTLQEQADLVLGAGEYERLTNEGCPPAFIEAALLSAIVYWGNGASEEAVHFYQDALREQRKTENSARPKAKTRKPSKNGRPTGKATP